MTLAADMITDLTTFYSSDDFAVSATLTVGATVTTPKVIFSNPYDLISPAGAGIAGTNPEARGKASDFTGVVIGTSTLTVAGTTYIIRDKRPVEDGLEVILTLSKD